MDFDEFLEKFYNGEIGNCDKGRKKLISAFGEDYYKSYVNLINTQLLGDSGYKLVIVKET